MSTTPAIPFGKKLQYWGESALFFPLVALFRVIGIDAASALGGFLGRKLYYRLSPAATARANLKAAYPEKSDAEIEAIVLKVCENLGRVVGEYAHLDKILMGGRLRVTGKEHGDAAVALGKGVMMFSGHLANWEVVPNAAHTLGYEGAIVYRPPNNPYVDRWILKQRAKRGPKDQISKGAQGTRRIFTLLRRGKSIFILIDQKTWEGVPAPFFGRDVWTTSAPAALALKMGSPLLPVSCRRTKGANFTVTIHPPIAFTPSGNYDADVLALTAAMNAKMEAMVREDPAQWLWTHHRWTSERDLLKIKAIQDKKHHALGGSGEAVARDGSSLS